ITGQILVTGSTDDIRREINAREAQWVSLAACRAFVQQRGLMNVAKIDAGNAPVPSRMDHPLLHEAERAKGVAHTPMSETRAARPWTVFISHELDGVELGSPPPDVHVRTACREIRQNFDNAVTAFSGIE
ncbi:MAG: hypothetical protein QOE55_8505, partial [Acidobacteriaceae bacterium]|nr:hypothetical protein [Acidobacteriaceae bacterium]